MSANVRNVLIVLALAGAVYALPGGGNTADTVAAVLSVLITASIAFFGYRMYRENRVALFSLGDRHRTILYASVGAIVVMMAARVRLFETGPGALLWFAVVIAAVYGLVVVFRHFRSYQY